MKKQLAGGWFVLCAYTPAAAAALLGGALLWLGVSAVRAKKGANNL